MTSFYALSATAVSIAQQQIYLSVAQRCSQRLFRQERKVGIVRKGKVRKGDPIVKDVLFEVGISQQEEFRQCCLLMQRLLELDV